jgi:enamine deaminase RidA (YjgF/YER057c/UK114 family)
MADTGRPGRVEYLNPDGLNANSAFSQAIAVEGNARTVYVGGQNAVNAAGEIVGEGDIIAQAEQVFVNLATALQAAGAELRHVVKWTIYVLEGQPAQAGFQVFQRVWANRGAPPTLTVVFVSGLAHPDYLMELDAIAVVPLDHE